MGTMWLNKTTFHIGGGEFSQNVVTIFGYKILLNTSPSGWSIRFGYPGIGLNVTTKPLFSVRNGYKKSIKLGKYYIVKL
jgi:hypothetical protein